jgi:AraC family transcriptional regulator of adaptative response/methylated-DNA-[protein]-cysteine methyltransferase
MRAKEIAVMDQQWQQVLARDAHSDGKFVYAVRSTGIYCRPTCPSRRPRRENVDFFAKPAAAEKAGFRACRRCRPNGVHPQLDIVHVACKYIDSHLDQRVTLAGLSKHLGYSPFYLQRLFKRTLGITPQEYQSTQRLANFKSNLRMSDNVTEAIYQAGYGSSSRLYEHATQKLGMTPCSYFNKGKGAKITFTIFDTALGNALMATTSKGVCSIQFGRSISALEADLRAEFSAAELHRDDKALANISAMLSKYISGQEHALNFPLDVRATAFQQLVWNALRQVPRGKTVSYSEVAKQIGAPRAHRAVARACASNPVAVAIPCHRVIHNDGNEEGYRWGNKRKSALLEAERSS